MPSSPRLKTLEGLVHEAARRLRKLNEEHRNLQAEIEQLRAENLRLSKDLKRFQGLTLRHDRVKARIEKLIHKIEKAERIA